MKWLSRVLSLKLTGKIFYILVFNTFDFFHTFFFKSRFMNVSLQNATVQGNDDQHYHFEEFFVRARNIRYVQIPEDVRPFS